MKLGELSKIVGGRIVGDPDLDITGVSGIEKAVKGEITFFTEKKDPAAIAQTAASAVIVAKELKGTELSQLVSENPLYTFARVLEVFHKKSHVPSGISKRASVGKGLKTGKDISIGDLAIISDNVSLGSNVVISEGCYIGEGVSIGDGSYIYPNVTIREKVKIGSNVTVHSGTVIGADGFGYVLEKGTHYKIPQVGGVIVGDDVEIGSNVVIDRATTDSTVIGQGTKIDNLVQIAHNVRIGKNCIIVAQAGIAGSAEIGDGVILAGQSGVRDHIKIGNGSILGAMSGAGSDIPDNEIYLGAPALPHETWMRANHFFPRLPDYAKRIKKLEKKLDDLKKSED